MNLFLGLTIAGLATGAIYAIAAAGLVLTYTTSGVFNFAHGSIGMLMAFLYWQLRVHEHWAAPYALAVVLLLAAPIVGAGIQGVVIRHVSVDDTGVMLVVTLALLVLGMGIAYSIWSPTEGRALLPFFGPDAHIVLLHRRVPYEDLISVGLAGVVAAALRLFLYHTRLGVLMRGQVDDRSLIGLNGVRVARLNALSWAIGAALGGLAGILQASQIDDLVVLDLTFLVVNSFAAAMLGRLRSLPLTFLGAILLGLADSYVGGYVRATSGILEQIRPVLPTLFLVAVLLVLPSVRLRVGAPPTRRAPRPPGVRASGVQALTILASGCVAAFVLHGIVLNAINIGMTVSIAGLAVVLLAGYGGQVNLAIYTFMGFGAWMFGRVASGSLLGVVIATVAGALIGAVFALPALRLRGLEMALSTLALAELAYFVFFLQPNVMGLGDKAVPRLRIPVFSLSGPRANLIFLAIVFAVLGFAMTAIRRSNTGRLLAATRDSPAACATLGHNLVVTKLVLSAAGTGLATFSGVLFGSTQRLVTANDFYFYEGLFIVLIVYVWGVHTPNGALFGGLSLAIFPLLTPHLPPRLQSLTYLGTGLAAIGIATHPNGTLDLVWSRIRPNALAVVASSYGDPARI